MGWLFRRCDEPGPNEEVRVRAQSLFGQSVVVRENLARGGDRRASRGEGGRWWSVWRDEDAVGGRVWENAWMGNQSFGSGGINRHAQGRIV